MTEAGIPKIEVEHLRHSYYVVCMSTRLPAALLIGALFASRSTPKEVAVALELSMAEAEPGSGIAILAAGGELDSQTVLHLEEFLDQVLRTHTSVVVDLSGIRYVSSAGWRAFVRRASLGADPHLKIAGMIPTVREVFDLLGLAHVLAAYPNVAEAVASFEPAIREP